MSDSGIPIINVKPQRNIEYAAVDGVTEVCESFSFHLNHEDHGGLRYENSDYFTSRKIRCHVEDRDWVAEALYDECQQVVRDRVQATIERLQARKGAKIAEQQRRAG
jgi:hypothetical protein